ncbi:MAG TPA: hypothetical protein VFC31_07555 [Candidatus Limnocylindria bacterium]|nr:hypothetical protein [Candidatus Limnocylindria bacterium]
MSEALPLFPVTTVGSWPRPASLIRALKDKNAGELGQAEFEAAADAAVLDILRVQEEAGVDVVTDGEQRRDNFYSFLADKLDGVKLMTMAELIDHALDKAYFHRTLGSLDAPSFVIKSPTVVGTLSAREPLAADATRFLRAHTRKAIKVPLPGPYLLARSIWVKGVSDGAYPSREALAADIVTVLREELGRLAAAGADFVQLDEPVLSNVVSAGRSPSAASCARLSRRPRATWRGSSAGPSSSSTRSSTDRPSAPACTSVAGTGRATRACCSQATTARSAARWTP